MLYKELGIDYQKKSKMEVELDSKLEEYIILRTAIIELYHLAKLYYPYKSTKNEAEKFSRKALLGEKPKVEENGTPKEIADVLKAERYLKVIKSGEELSEFISRESQEISKQEIEKVEKISALLADYVKALKDFENANPDIKMRYRQFRMNKFTIGKYIYNLIKIKEEFEMKIALLKSTSRPELEKLEYEAVVKKYEEVIEAANKKIESLINTEKGLTEFLFYRALVDREEIMRTGFFTSSIQKEIEKQVMLALINKRPLFLVGYTGTGKTEGLIYALRKIGKELGKDVIVFPCGRDTTQSDLFGVGEVTETKKESGEKEIKAGIKPVGVSAAVIEGKIIILDEANAMEPGVTKELLPIIDAYMNKRGVVTLPMGIGEQKIGDGFAIFFTGNPKLEGYKGIEEFDNALSRRLWTVVINYPPLEDIKRFITAFLVDPMDFSIDPEVAEKGNKLAEAIHLIHQLYTGEKKDFWGVGSDQLTGKGSYLSTATITFKDVKEIIQGWRNRGYKGNPDKEIIAYIKRQNAPEEDKKLLLQVFAIFGLLDEVIYYEVKDIVDEKTFMTWVKKSKS